MPSNIPESSGSLDFRRQKTRQLLSIEENRFPLLYPPPRFKQSKHRMLATIPATSSWSIAHFPFSTTYYGFPYGICHTDKYLQIHTGNVCMYGCVYGCVCEHLDGNKVDRAMNNFDHNPVIVRMFVP